MKFNRLSLRPFVTFAAGLFVLVACQNATEPNSGSGPLLAKGGYSMGALSRLPDSVTWKGPSDAGFQKPSCVGLDCTDTFRLSRPLGSDSLTVQLWTLGVQTSTIYYGEQGNSSTLYLKTSILRDSLDILLLSLYATLPSAQKTAFSALGQGSASLVAYYASLILSQDTVFLGKSYPVGMNADSVKKDLVYLGSKKGLTVFQLLSLNDLNLDTNSIRTFAAILVRANLLPTADTLGWFHPVRVKAAASLAGSLTAGGSALAASGSFSWNPGVQVNLSPISVRTPNPEDSSNFQLFYQFNPGKTDTTWSLTGNLTVQALASAPVGWDTLVVTLTSDPIHAATVRVPFQVAAKDITPPTLTILSPTQDTTTVSNATATFVVKAIATDSGSGVDSLKIGAKTKYSGASIVDTLSETLALVVGANAVSVQAWDHARNTSNLTITVTRAPAPVNKKPPTVIHVSPTQDTETVPWGTKSATLSWTITRDTTITSVQLNGHPLAGNTGLYQTSLPLNVGLNIFPLTAVDAYGLSAYDTLRITRQGDTSHPIVMRGTSTDDTVLVKSQSSFSPSWTVTDNALDSVTINGVVAIAGNSNTYSAPVTLSGDSLWITLVAKDSSRNFTRDSIKVRRLALVGITGSGTTYSGSQTPLATLSSNIPGARIGYSTDRVSWSSYPAGGITISKNVMLYAQDTIGAVVSGIDSAVFLYIPTPTLSGITATQATAAIAPAGSIGIEDSLSTGTNWLPYTNPFPVLGNTKVFARSHLGGSVSSAQEIDFAVAPLLAPSPNDTGVNSVSVAVALQGADSVQVSTNQQNWVTLPGPSPTYLATTNGTLYGRSRVGSAISVVDSIVVTLYPSPPRFSLASGPYLAPQPVTLTTSPAGANIYYTTDGSTPTIKSTLYTKPISVAKTFTLKAIAANGSAINGTVDSAFYAIADTNSYGIPWNSKITYGTLWDTRDNQVYRTVKIGSQTWMAQNLNYRNTIGSSDTTGVCYNNGSDSCSKYGRLYNWAQAMLLPAAKDTECVVGGPVQTSQCPGSLSGYQQGICPDRWHIPSDSEWTVMLTSVNGDNSMDEFQLKSKNGWTSSAGNGSDNIGFRILPGGSYIPGDNVYSGSFEQVGDYTFWWESGENGPTNAWYKGTDYDLNIMDRGEISKQLGYSMRCIATTTP